MKRALVTGDRGFVGRHVRTALEAAGWSVVGLDIKRRWNEDVRLVFRQDAPRYDLVVHCAAVVGGRETIEGNPLALAVNLEIDAAMFSWAQRTKPGRVVYLSSSAAYPVSCQRDYPHWRLREDFIDLAYPAAPDQLYGWSKLTGEMLAVLARSAGVPVTVLRPFSGYGADQDLTYPFPSFIDRAVRRANPFDIWGTGEQVRDWVHVEDLTNAIMAAVAAEIDGPVNLCTGRGVSFNELAQMVTDVAGYSPRFAHKLDAPTGVSYRVGDPTLMKLFYTPKVSLEEGIARALDR